MRLRIRRRAKKELRVLLLGNLTRDPELRYTLPAGAGWGDYTRDRDQWLSGLTIEHVEEEIRRMKARGEL